MFHDVAGPIQRFEWGLFVIADQIHTKGLNAGKDIRLIGTEVSPWTERVGHLLSAEMIAGVYDRGIEVLIIGNGVNQALQCPEDVQAAIASRGISELRILATPVACKEYNELHSQGRKVALLAHGTC